MKRRCYDKNDKSYKYYGERGIVVCDEWKNNFDSFYKWAIENGFDINLTIDRIDVNGNYCPENCRWITIQEQQRNKRNNVVIRYDGEDKPLSVWAKEKNIKETTLRARVNSNTKKENLFLDKSCFEKINNKKGRGTNNPNQVFIKYNGKKQNISQWAKDIGITQEALWNRLYVSKMDIKDALLTKEELKKRNVDKGTKKKRMITYNGETHSVSEWARIYNINPKVLSDRLNKLESPFEKAILPAEEYRRYRKSLKQGD